MGLKGMGILNYQSSYLSGEKHFINKLKRIKGNKIIFDVGANVGNYSKLILRNINDVSIYAFEPIPYLSRNWMRTLGQNKLPNIILGFLIILDHR